MLEKERKTKAFLRVLSVLCVLAVNLYPKKKIARASALGEGFVRKMISYSGSNYRPSRRLSVELSLSLLLLKVV